MGRDTSAISRPPCNFCQPCSEVGVYASAYLPAAGFKHLGEVQLVGTAQAQQVVYFNKKIIEKADGNCTPLHNDIVVSCEHGDNLHAWLAFHLSIALVLSKTSLIILWFQSQESSIDEKPTIPVLRKSGQKFGTGKMDVKQLGHGNHERVCEPLCKLVERNDVFPGVGRV